jgi:site-specific recombinase XerD
MRKKAECQVTMHTYTNIFDEYNSIYDEIVRQYYLTSECKKKLVYLALLIIIRNGLRVTESITAIHEFMKQLNRIIQIKALKKGNMRHVVFPEEVSILDLLYYKLCVDELNRHQIKIHAYKKLHVNPHYLRRLYIKTLYSEGYSVEYIKNIIGHVDKANTLHYIKL